ncbi:MAG: hypothetical protein FWG21_06970, partial [Oscillospiraceae bacterium]|nr:hypothetical protein [Oscillospiraceae bacterium]
FKGEISAARLYENSIMFVSGQVLYSSQISGSEVQEVFGNLPVGIQYIAFSAEGDILFGNNSEVIVYSKDGVYVSQFGLDNSIQMQHIMDLEVAPNGNVIALIFDERDGYIVREVSNDSFEGEIDIALPESTNIRGMTIYDGSAIITTIDGLTLCNDADEYRILNWMDIGVSGTFTYVAGVTRNADVILLNRKDGCLYKVIAVDAERIELTLAYVSETDTIPSALAEAVARFNTLSKEHRINPIRFTTLEQLNMQIIAGDIPDLVLVSYPFPFENYVSKGVFEDLTPYINVDSETNLVPVVQRILSSDGGLFRVTPGFNIMTFIGVSDFVGMENGWTLEEMKQCLAEAPKDSTIFPSFWDAEAIFIFLVYQNMDEFVDWELGKALFDTAAFKELLEFTDTVPKSYQRIMPDTPLVLIGRELVMHSTIISLDHFVAIDNFMGGKAVFKGIPSSNKYSGVFYLNELTLSMTSACKDKTGVWSFLRNLLLSDDNFQTIPTIQSKLEIEVDIAMTPGRSYVNERTQEQIDIAPMTQEQYEKFIIFLDGIGSVLSGNTVIQRIITEEIPAYFGGDKSVDEVCRIIQARAQIYVSEQS